MWRTDAAVGSIPFRSTESDAGRIAPRFRFPVLRSGTSHPHGSLSPPCLLTSENKKLPAENGDHRHFNPTDAQRKSPGESDDRGIRLVLADTPSIMRQQGIFDNLACPESHSRNHSSCPAIPPLGSPALDTQLVFLWCGESAGRGISTGISSERHLP